MGVENLQVYNDLELIINQMQREYLAKDAVWLDIWC